MRNSRRVVGPRDAVRPALPTAPGSPQDEGERTCSEEVDIAPVESVFHLTDERALETDLAGAKAAALAMAASAGLPVLRGFVIPTSFEHNGASDYSLRAAWSRLSEEGRIPLVVRSSSTAEDGTTSSMAGRFVSVVGVDGWDAFLEAVSEVMGSAAGPRAVGGQTGRMAVLVQPVLDAALGGIMFGLDPVSGEDNVIVSVVEGGPECLVSGATDGERYVLGFGGRILQGPAERNIRLPLARRAALVRLAAGAARAFGGPQDVEWGIDRAGKLWLFQSRPITARAEAKRGRGPVFGPGPLAETFPHPLTALEEDLWFEPLRVAVTEAFAITGAASHRTLKKRPVVATISGRPAADLEMFGYRETKKTFISRLDPRGPVRRLKRSWAVGRLKMALPSLAIDLLDRVDEELAKVPPPAELSDEQLDALLSNSFQMLVALHGYEVLVGALTPADEAATSAGSIALRALAEGRLEGLEDSAIVHKLPWVLALVPPSVAPWTLPGAGSVLRLPEAQGDETPSVRENLRMRVRWVQELTARAAREIGARLERRGLLNDERSVGHVRLAAIRGALMEGAPVGVIDPAHADTAPLPAAFRFSTDGSPIAELATSGSVAAGGGRVVGTVRGPGEEDGDVLVVRTLDPDLAPLLTGIKALVSETGSPLSHLAILAREMGIATVVSVQDATSRFVAGQRVVVDGRTGEVELPIDPLQVIA